MSDAGRAYRMRMHTSAPGEALDYWNWRAATTDPLQAADAGPARAFPAFMSAEGINANPLALYKGDAGIGRPAAIPFDPAGALPTTRIPGWLMQRASPLRDDVSAAGRWSGGYWTVEFSRPLTTPDPRDAQFPLK